MQQGIEAGGLQPRRRGAPARRVLVVEDNVDSALLLAELLRRTGYDVRVAHDGPRALAEARSYQPEVVLLDIGLPGMDGYQVARELRRQEGAGSPFLVALTGYGQAEHRRLSEDAGFDRHVVKPVTLEALTSVIPAPTSS